MEIITQLGSLHHKGARRTVGIDDLPFMRECRVQW
jgi:hypothetical protein